ncbi:hypothetical protein DPEC_G00005430 [Dallia pectoralis]|uniref:Uncharacterized protein n=1 Tax=Dallia pectoralis TaxID=75939 RepID=A0ACC2HK95_DALPE|nr:hypothetical protein DPEC_G00005430 [Dallia pectoralis]
MWAPYGGAGRVSVNQWRQSTVAWGLGQGLHSRHRTCNTANRRRRKIAPTVTMVIPDRQANNTATLSSSRSFLQPVELPLKRHNHNAKPMGHEK